MLTPSERLAQLINRAMVEATGPQDTGVRGGNRRDLARIDRCLACGLSVGLHYGHDGTFIGCYAAGERRHA